MPVSATVRIGAPGSDTRLQGGTTGAAAVGGAISATWTGGSGAATTGGGGGFTTAGDRVTPTTGLLTPDVFYFGNAIGEAGDNPINTIVNATDEIVARNFQHSAVDQALVDDAFDYNRDQLVNSTDQLIARENQTNPLTMLRLFTLPIAKASPQATSNPAALDWLYQYEQANTKQAKSNPTKEAIDQLLATDWAS